jgi:MerR family transcriptional regulator, copper efflux regulator
MQSTYSISALAKSVGVTSKTLRHWERLGLLPKAARTHAGYRVFTPGALRYVEFVRKAKSVGLTLAEMKRVLELSRQGKNPCPDVLQWIDEKDKALEQQILSLRSLQKRLRAFRRHCSTSPVITCARPDELCCLIEGLLDRKLPKGGAHEKILLAGASPACDCRS